ncbi:hypothetical protein CDAR_211481 [Caerostris darwini]|uniref:Uncharacterized protein n=1 Tax=Caerostris darwini TaxID=1538125 RepID=A0AAV4P2D4_9ARAC|nr:hypothetical protein CDAR_211481 [Caerostris darwini]
MVTIDVRGQVGAAVQKSFELMASSFPPARSLPCARGQQLPLRRRSNCFWWGGLEFSGWPFVCKRRLKCGFSTPKKSKMMSVYPFHLISGVKQRAMRKPSRTKPVIKEGSIGRSFNDPVWRAAITQASNEPRLHRGANNAHSTAFVGLIGPLLMNK